MAEDVWTVKRILEWIEGYLAQHGDDNPRLSAQWLVAEALGATRMQLFLELDRPLNAEERAVIRDYTRRRGAGEPLQYITGTVGFRHIAVRLRPGVLIPRPETELLVSEALALLPVAPKPQDEYEAELLRQWSADAAAAVGGGDDGREGGRTGVAPSGAAEAVSAGAQRKEARGSDDAASSDAQKGRLLVADICTGSGCIACSIAHEHPATQVIATDISPEAVALARENADALGLSDRVAVCECDLGAGIDPTLVGSFALVVSNPPYVPSGLLPDLPREVADYEPALALDGGPDGLDVFRRLLAWCAGALAPGGGFAFELHETCLDDAAAEARALRFDDVRIVDDLAGRPRVLVGRRSEA